MYSWQRAGMRPRGIIFLTAPKNASITVDAQHAAKKEKENFLKNAQIRPEGLSSKKFHSSSLLLP